MAEELRIASGGKSEKYNMLFEQIKSLVDIEKDPIAIMANIAAMIHETFSFLWTGFYRVIGNELVLGPFQGPMACLRIKFGRGVCGSAWKENRILIIPNVEEFEGHIACSSLSKSEIVIPLRNNGKIVGVLDIDSENLNTFDMTDALWLEKICVLVPNPDSI